VQRELERIGVRVLSNESVHPMPDLAPWLELVGVGDVSEGKPEFEYAPLRLVAIFLSFVPFFFLFSFPWIFTASHLPVRRKRCEAPVALTRSS
jgi:hypothetical protein